MACERTSQSKRSSVLCPTPLEWLVLGQAFALPGGAMASADILDLPAIVGAVLLGAHVERAIGYSIQVIGCSEQAGLDILGGAWQLMGMCNGDAGSVHTHQLSSWGAGTRFGGYASRTSLESAARWGCVSLHGMHWATHCGHRSLAVSALWSGSQHSQDHAGQPQHPVRQYCSRCGPVLDPRLSTMGQVPGSQLANWRPTMPVTSRP